MRSCYPEVQNDLSSCDVGSLKQPQIVGQEGSLHAPVAVLADCSGSDRACDDDVSRGYSRTYSTGKHGQTTADTSCYPVRDIQMMEPRGCAKHASRDGQSGRIYRIK